MASEQDRLRDLPLSRHVVLHVLKKAEEPLTTRQIAERTKPFGGLSQRTVQRCVDQLKRLGAVEQQPSGGPAPKPRYEIKRSDNQQ